MQHSGLRSDLPLSIEKVFQLQQLASCAQGGSMRVDRGSQVFDCQAKCGRPPKLQGDWWFGNPCVLRGRELSMGGTQGFPGFHLLHPSFTPHRQPGSPTTRVPGSTAPAAPLTPLWSKII